MEQESETDREPLSHLETLSVLSKRPEAEVCSVRQGRLNVTQTDEASCVKAMEHMPVRNDGQQ